MKNIKIKNNEQDIKRCKYCMEPCGSWCCDSCYELFEGEAAYDNREDDDEYEDRDE